MFIEFKIKISKIGELINNFIQIFRHGHGGSEHKGGDDKKNIFMLEEIKRDVRRRKSVIRIAKVILL